MKGGRGKDYLCERHDGSVRTSVWKSAVRRLAEAENRIHRSVATVALVLASEAACASNEPEDARNAPITRVDAEPDDGPSAGGPMTDAAACKALEDEMIEWILAHDDCTEVGDCIASGSSVVCLRGSPNNYAPRDCSKSIAIRADADNRPLAEMGARLEHCYSEQVWASCYGNLCGTLPAVDCIEGACRIVDCEPGCDTLCNGMLNCQCVCADASGP